MYLTAPPFRRINLLHNNHLTTAKLNLFIEREQKKGFTVYGQNYRSTRISQIWS